MHVRRSTHISANTFNINAFDDAYCVTNYRFKLRDIGVIRDLINWPGGRTKRNGYKCDSITATCIVLRRLAAPIRWVDIEKEFSMFSSQLCEVFWEVLRMLLRTRSHLLSIRPGLLRNRARTYAAAIHSLGAPLDRCVGFIDCTKVKMCRPSGPNIDQRCCYSGHKRFHCLNYQTLSTPDGLIFALWGPEVGRRHDLTLMRKSGWDPILSEVLVIDGIQFYIFGDAAYRLSPHIQVPFRFVGATEEERQFNTRMSAARVAVEWHYKDVKQMWSMNDFARRLKVKQSPIACMYIASVLLLNFRTCMYGGGQTSAHFNLQPPSLEDYVNSA